MFNDVEPPVGGMQTATNVEGGVSIQFSAAKFYFANTDPCVPPEFIYFGGVAYVRCDVAGAQPPQIES